MAKVIPRSARIAGLLLGTTLIAASILAAALRRPPCPPASTRLPCRPAAGSSDAGVTAPELDQVLRWNGSTWSTG